jgi:hypothetical protein
MGVRLRDNLKLWLMCLSFCLPASLMAFADPRVDFKGDGKSDVLVFRSGDGYVGQWLSNGNGTWTDQSRVFIGGIAGVYQVHSS